MRVEQKFDPFFDIPSAGVIALELTGERKVIEAAVKWLPKNGVQVDLIEMDVLEG